MTGTSTDAPAAAPTAAAGTTASTTAAGTDAPTAAAGTTAAGTTAAGTDTPAAAPSAAAPHTPAPASPPLPFTPTVFLTPSARRWNADRRTRRAAPIRPMPPRRYGPFTAAQWVGTAIVAGAGLVYAAAMVVLAVRWFLSLEFMRAFAATYPGQYALPEIAPVGIPGWLAWQHFFNVFLIVLIIRSGLQVRHQKRPSAFWSARGARKRKISLSLWFHQSLDILWLVNGAIFVVLLFVTGQWMRIVPTSWQVFPNALTAALKYASLNWPTEDGWVNYNSLQQLAYVTTVFVAAPLAAVTGVRMSGVWPAKAKALSKAYPIEWARAVHFPVMLYFCLFIIVHVTLVLATGALRNLNHMFGGSDEVNGTGFWIFVAALAVITAAWAAARPLVLAPIARLFGTVSGR